MEFQLFMFEMIRFTVYSNSENCSRNIVMIKKYEICYEVDRIKQLHVIASDKEHQNKLQFFVVEKFLYKMSLKKFK